MEKKKKWESIFRSLRLKVAYRLTWEKVVVLSSMRKWKLSIYAYVEMY